VTEHHDVVVVAGGQAGLAIGYLLAREGRQVAILEAADRPRWHGERGGTR